MRTVGVTATDREEAPTSEEYERLFRQEGERMWRTLFGFTGGRGDIAEEAVAEAFARAIASPKVLRDPLRWMYRTAFRVAIDEIRAERRRDAATSIRSADPPSTDGELLGALRELSPNQRAAIVMRYEADLSIEEIARRLGVTAPTVRVHLHRGRRRLRDLLGSKEEADD
jgi:RNA polymerase sigma-70 factor (ECF subfamily)